ncbi:hypothetical protein [Peptoniphilus asaccharolyticus]|uniref:hypothetical protein n=1 Tax=Peptoniphilus asaccharolyticus TaxID=1258 RepID=UPI001F188924|nr:hypothetical protein [Peptoniphilus asaccharolyticus]
MREFYPKGMDLSEVNIDELNYNLSLMNNRPRKCIKYKTPKEELFWSLTIGVAFDLTIRLQ